MERRIRRLAGATAGIALVLVAAAGVAGAQVPPTASASSRCAAGVGVIDVEIVDDFSTTYDVFIDDVLVGDDVTDSDGGVYSYQPYADGSHTVVVLWNIEELDILDTTVLVECVPDPTTTSTAAPTTTSTVAATTVAQPRFTG